MNWKVNFLELDKDINGKIYNIEAANKIIEDFQSQKPYSVLGEFRTSIDGEIITSLKNVTHVINNIWIENDKLVGEIRLLETPDGKAVKQVIDILFEKDLIKYLAALNREKKIDSLFEEGNEEVVENDVIPIFENIGLTFDPRIEYLIDNKIVKIQKFITFDINIKLQ